MGKRMSLLVQPDPPESMNFTTNTSTGTDQSEGTLVEFTCAVDANPAPMLSVWTRDEDGTEEKIFEQTSAELTFDASVHLTKQHHGIIFFCRAVGSSYTLTSDTTYMYNVKCKFDSFITTAREVTLCGKFVCMSVWLCL